MSVGTFFRGRREIYRGSGYELVIDEGARDELATRIMLEGVHPAAEAIAQRCNDNSSWGGYQAFLTERVARVYALSAGKDSERGRRLLAAVDSVAP